MSAPTALASDPDAIVINSFSKYFSMTGWRLGWIIVPEQLRSAVTRVAQNVTIAAPTVAQHAALGAFECAEELDDIFLGALLPLGLTADDGDGDAAAQRDRIPERGHEQHHLDGLPDDLPGEDEVGLHRPLLATHDGGDARGLFRPVRDRLVGLQDAHVDRGDVLEARHGYASDGGFFSGERPRRHSLDVVEPGVGEPVVNLGQDERHHGTGADTDPVARAHVAVHERDRALAERVGFGRRRGRAGGGLVGRPRRGGPRDAGRGTAPSRRALTGSVDARDRGNGERDGRHGSRTGRCVRSGRVRAASACGSAGLCAPTRSG